jgi:threonine/homoserine/homoserine lactone efflux protein
MWFPILARLPFAIAGVIAGWFVAEGTVRFDIVQLGVSLVMLAAFLAAALYAPTILRWFGLTRDR